MKVKVALLSLVALLIIFAGCSAPEPDTPLTIAAAKSDAAKVKALLTQGADANQKDRNGYTALMYAARNGHMEIIEALLKAGADINARDTAVNHWTALIHAIHKNQNKAAHLLIERGANVNIAGDHNVTPLMYAASYDNTEMVKTLLERGANPYGMHGSDTALSSAIRGLLPMGDPDRPSSSLCPTETVKALLAKAADLKVRGNLLDRTALFFARQKGCTEIVELLEQRQSVPKWDQTSSQLGPYFVRIAPDSWLWGESSSSDSENHRFTSGTTNVVIKGGELIVNGKSYGWLKHGDIVDVDYGKVLINSTETKELASK